MNFIIEVFTSKIILKTTIMINIIFKLIIILVLLISCCCFADPNLTEDHQVDSNVPIIIWYYGAEKSPQVLKMAVDSGIFTHIMLAGMHRFDVPDYTIDPNFRENILICKNAGVKIIWKRWLWPGYNFKKFKYESVFDSQYYIDEINFIKQEAMRIGADYTSFDSEVYGKNTLRSIPWRRGLTKHEYESISNAIKIATKTAGKVDFLLPAAMPYPRHTRFKRDFSKPFPNLGFLSIAEHTYFNNPSRIYCENNKYDIFGAWCVPDPNYNVISPRFSPEDIFIKYKYYWQDTKGLFFYSETKDQDLILKKIQQINN